MYECKRCGEEFELEELDDFLCDECRQQEIVDEDYDFGYRERMRLQEMRRINDIVKEYTY